MSPSAEKRLSRALERRLPDATIEAVTPDASNREYFRVSTEDGSLIACVYSEPFDDSLPYLDTTALFLAAGLPVARVLEFSGEDGIVFQEDLGDTSLGEYLKDKGSSEREEKIDSAIGLIARIQAATGLAFERNSIASRLRFDREKLLWELGFFTTHFFGSLLERPNEDRGPLTLARDFEKLCVELENYARVLTHRDFHAANLMVIPGRSLAMIDHQDARIGSAAYDLVSLLLDRITDVPDEEHLAGKRRVLIERRAEAGLEPISEEEFALEFRLVAIQRCLKAIGTFSNQAANAGREHYLVYVAPMFRTVLENCRMVGGFEAIEEMIERLFDEGTLAGERFGSE